MNETPEKEPRRDVPRNRVGARRQAFLANGLIRPGDVAPFRNVEGLAVFRLDEAGKRVAPTRRQEIRGELDQQFRDAVEKELGYTAEQWSRAQARENWQRHALDTAKGGKGDSGGN